eukprot:TRINITY_DN1641_c0_g1_i1.p1 TRINITY_DN1641_c0_g1~~TRINITY_DN1641_c0_g1_i1.p1  ORF type:complete len:219 (-),score=38.66 TRINITY_DN1641_c0_g1_i1:157-813(-)
MFATRNIVSRVSRRTRVPQVRTLAILRNVVPKVSSTRRSVLPRQSIVPNVFGNNFNSLRMYSTRPTRVITFHYVLTNNTGQVVDSSRDAQPLAFMEGTGHIIEGLERELVKMSQGQSAVIKVDAKDAYGHKSDDLIFKIEKEKIPGEKVKVGDQFSTKSQPNIPLTVIEIDETHVTLDGNHPLAGVDLTFDVEIIEVRDATEEEVNHGHAHGPHGHHH